MPKRKNKNKNKRAQEEDLENGNNDTEPKLSKREKRRQKKTQKQEEEQQIECNPQEEEHKDQCINESNKEDEKIYLNSIKEKQQQSLLEIGNNLLANLDDKYFPFFTKEFEDIWEQQMIEIVLFYDQKHICNNLESLQSETLFAEKKHELESIWNEEIFALLLEDFETTQQHKTIKMKHKKYNKSKQKQVPRKQTEEIEEKAETEEKYFENENENENEENTSQCPICLADDYTMLCELDCYIYRTDNVKHCICSECVRKLFKSNRWYQRAKCPFCRHTINRDVIMNNNINASELSENDRNEAGGDGYIDRSGLHQLYWNSYRQYLRHRENIFEQNSSWNNYELHHRNGSVYYIKYSAVLLLIGIVCFYYSYMWIGLILVIISFLVFVMNHEFDDELFNNLGEEMRIFYEERTVPRRAQRSLQHVRNRNVRVRNSRKDSNVYGNRVSRYRNKIKNKKLKVGRQTQKYNKRFRNRNFR